MKRMARWTLLPFFVLGLMSAIGRVGTFSYTTDVPGATLTSMTLGHWRPSTFPRYHRVGVPVRSRWGLHTRRFRLIAQLTLLAGPSR